MARPQVTCNADQVVAYDASARLIQLGATATGSPTSYRWTILSAPPGSTVGAGTKGDFVNGVAVVQNPQLLIDGAVDGSYAIQCVATNADGESNPQRDKASGQQFIVVRTETSQLWLPPDYGYDWGEKYLNPTLRALEGAGGSGGPEPFWEWNKTDLTQFTLVDGRDVTSSSAAVYSSGARSILRIISSASVVSDLRATLLMANATPPSKNYVVVAEMGGLSADGKGIAGVRMAMDPGDWYSGVIAIADGPTGNMRAEVHTGLDEGAVVMAAEDSNITYDATDAIMHRVFIGSDGPPSMLSHWAWSPTPDTEGDLAVHFRLRSYGVYSCLTGVGYSYIDQIANPGKIAIGVTNGTAFFTGVRAYELPSDGSPLQL